MKKYIWTILFFFSVLGHILLDGILTDRSNLIPTKIIPTLILIGYLVKYRKSLLFDNKFSFFLITLVLILFGDICLLFPKLFSLGLILYIVAQGIYTYIFLNRNTISISSIVGFCVYGIFAITLFITKVDKSLVIPVIIYIFALMSMGYAVFSNRDKKYFLLYIGATLFIFSDTLLAYIRLNHIISAFWNATILLTYFSAQFCLVFGSLRNEKE
ncbi:lysoplasmalogenase family protein [Leptospira perdikensis]|uniref:Lysoplasmalogenase n=1 Tax=Leptospira perdikensis TaxID=2484948 RepID=A0A4R9JIV4_9LEPT|nr:lysoplasmalogenase family protein [Leptospira perdikensis]TGL44148.1 hypothetical protein EHQ49_01300 [Leptospira perdikensis]